MIRTYIEKPRLLIHQLCLAILTLVLYITTPEGDFAFLLPILFLLFSGLTASMYRQLSSAALLADIVASVSITCSISLMFISGYIGGDFGFLINVFLLIGIVAIAIQIRLNSIEIRKNTNLRKH